MASPSSSTSPVPGYIGIDIGTQGLSVLFTDKDLKVLAKGDASYGYSNSKEQQNDDGCYEQLTSYWEEALQQSMQQVLQQQPIHVLAIGISGQMHGEVLMNNENDGQSSSIAPVRLWCDARNANEGNELTTVFDFKVPKRATCARFLWTVRNRPELASQTKHLTTPAGYIAFRLTGRHVLGIGDAAGMFPINPETQNYDTTFLKIYNQLLQAEKERNPNHDIPTRLENLLPTIRKAGQDAGILTASGAALLGLQQIFDNSSSSSIPVAAGEGDQVAALAGSLIGKSGTVSCSFGTSVCANLVGNCSLSHVSPAVDHFCAANGTPIHMVWLRNGTTFLNTMIQSYASVSDDNNVNAFDTIMPALVAASPDCGGLVALPFMDDEPGLGVAQEGGSTAVILGWNTTNATPGNITKSALLSTMFNLKTGCHVVQAAGNIMNEIVLSGGLTKTPECGQILADVFNLPVRLLEASDEGCSWGACVLASYRYYCCCKMNVNNNKDDNDKNKMGDWPTFLAALVEQRPHEKIFQPEAQVVEQYSIMYRKYQKLMQLEPQLRNVMRCK